MHRRAEQADIGRHSRLGQCSRPCREGTMKSLKLCQLNAGRQTFRVRSATLAVADNASRY